MLPSTSSQVTMPLHGSRTVTQASGFIREAAEAVQWSSAEDLDLVPSTIMVAHNLL